MDRLTKSAKPTRTAMDNNLNQRLDIWLNQ